MIDHPEPQQAIPDPKASAESVESGALERPILRRRIDCGTNAASPLDRRIAARGGRRRDDARI